ncbi:MAG: hypothetical protein F6K26_50345 [Moorea sp. SIO2I5]|nr:hypothetical protein [Moorena sp. SIO2I5]
MSQPAIVAAFADLPDSRRTAGQRHSQALCLALFTLAVAAGNRGFLAIGDWLKASIRSIGCFIFASQRTLTVLQHDSTDVATGGISDVFRLFISVFWGSTPARRNHCHRWQSATGVL